MASALFSSLLTSDAIPHWSSYYANVTTAIKRGLQLSKSVGTAIKKGGTYIHSLIIMPIPPYPSAGLRTG